MFRSRKPQAERFKRWLAHEVLPALRKTGRYEMPKATKRRQREEVTDDLLNEPLSRLRAKLDMVREARLLHGHNEARRLWSALNLPPSVSSREEAIEIMRAREELRRRLDEID